MPMALHGKNGFEVVKINIRALPIIFRKWRPWQEWKKSWSDTNFSILDTYFDTYL